MKKHHNRQYTTHVSILACISLYVRTHTQGMGLMINSVQLFFVVVLCTSVSSMIKYDVSQIKRLLLMHVYRGSVIRANTPMYVLIIAPGMVSTIPTVLTLATGIKI